MSNIYFTVTGLYHYYGDSFLEKEMIGTTSRKRTHKIDKF